MMNNTPKDPDDDKLCTIIKVINKTVYPSATKHTAIILFARQANGRRKWPGIEQLAMDSGIPSGLVEKAVNLLRVHRILRFDVNFATEERIFKMSLKYLVRAANRE